MVAAIRSTVAEMRDVARHDRIGRIALIVVWLGLAVMSAGATTLQLTPMLTRRELI